MIMRDGCSSHRDVVRDLFQDPGRHSSRSYRRGGYTTLPEHSLNLTRSTRMVSFRIIHWASQIGLTPRNCCLDLQQRPHPERDTGHVWACFAWGNYSPERLEAACSRALDIKAYSYKNVESILRRDGPKPSPFHHLKDSFSTDS